MTRRKVGGLLVSPDPVFTSRMIQIVTLTTRHGIPAVFQSREWAEAGGLMSYGADVSEVYRQVGVYTGRILKGAKPADLPVEHQVRVRRQPANRQSFRTRNPTDARCARRRGDRVKAGDFRLC